MAPSGEYVDRFCAAAGSCLTGCPGRRWEYPCRFCRCCRLAARPTNRRWVSSAAPRALHRTVAGSADRGARAAPPIPRASKSAAWVSTRPPTIRTMAASCDASAAPRQTPAKALLGCLDKSPIFGGAVCQTGWSRQYIPDVGIICAPTKEQSQCCFRPTGQQHRRSMPFPLCPGTAWPARQCCTGGSVLSGSGR